MINFNKYKNSNQISSYYKFLNKNVNHIDFFIILTINNLFGNLVTRFSETLPPAKAKLNFLENKMNNDKKIVLTENAIKRHSKRLLEEIKKYDKDFTLGESQNMFARTIGLNNWHELKKLLENENADDSTILSFLSNIKDDTYYLSKDQVFYKDKGNKINYVNICFSPQQIEDFLKITWGEEAISKLMCGNALDYRFKVEESHFRINATCGNKNNEKRIDLTISRMNKIILDLNLIKLNKNILKYIKKPKGLNIVSGIGYGSGKASLLNSVMNDIGKDKNEHILSYESPIEYTYDDINVSQMEVGRDILSFSDGIRNALRRSPSRILVGELRDIETFNSVVQAVSSGYNIYTTDNQSSIIKSLLYYKSISETDNIFKRFLDNLNLLINQTVIISDISKEPILLQEFLVFSPKVVEKILSVIDNHEKLENMVNSLIDINEGSFKEQINKLEKDKLISHELYLKLLKDY